MRWSPPPPCCCCRRLLAGGCCVGGRGGCCSPRTAGTTTGCCCNDNSSREGPIYRHGQGGGSGNRAYYGGNRARKGSPPSAARGDGGGEVEWSEEQVPGHRPRQRPCSQPARQACVAHVIPIHPYQEVKQGWHHKRRRSQRGGRAVCLTYLPRRCLASLLLCLSSVAGRCRK